MKRLLNFILSAVAIAMSVACSEKKEEVIDTAPENLYIESKQLLKSYTDSFRNAKDTCDIQRLTDDFEAELLKINMKYPAETDMRLSEGENDTLYILTKKLLLLKEKSIKRILSSKENSDSVA